MPIKQKVATAVSRTKHCSQGLTLLHGIVCRSSVFIGSIPCLSECKPRRGAMFIAGAGSPFLLFVFQRRGEETNRIIRSRLRRAAEKQKKSISVRCYKH